MSVEAAGTRLVDIDDLEVLSRESIRGGTAQIALVRHLGKVCLVKQYDDEDREQIDAVQLHRLIAWRLGLPDSERAYLDGCAAWPRRVVQDTRGVCGVLLPLAPQMFLEHGFDEAVKPRHLTRLTRPCEVGRPYYEMPEKLARLGHLGRLMLFLHARGVVIGDLQPNNVLTTAPATQPVVLLIDCDSVVLEGGSVLPQMDPALYRLPVPRSFDVASDYYKFAAIVVRCLEEDNSAWDCQDVRALQVLRAQDLSLLRRARREELKPEDAQHWDALFKNWRSSVSRHGQLFHRNDEFIWREWAGLDTDGEPSKDRQDVGTCSAEGAGRGSILRRTAAAACLTVLVVALLLALVAG